MRTTTTVEPDLRPGLEGLVAFCALIEEPLEPYMRRIAKAYFGKAREVAAILPRGCAKTTLAALIGTHHLLTVEGAAVTIGPPASSRPASAWSGSRASPRTPRSRAC